MLRNKKKKTKNFWRKLVCRDDEQEMNNNLMIVKGK